MIESIYTENVKLYKGCNQSYKDRIFDSKGFPDVAPGNHVNLLDSRLLNSSNLPSIFA